METFWQVWHEWFPHSGRERGSGPEFEFCGPDFEPADPNSTIYICVSLKRAD